MLLLSAGDTEIRVVRDRDAWDIDPEFHARRYGPEDRFIDSSGAEYRTTFQRGRSAIVPTGRRFSAKEVEDMAVRRVVDAGGAREWLEARLAEVAENQRIRAAILYLSKLAAPDVSESAEDEE
jgi:hypothetical protein